MQFIAFNMKWSMSRLMGLQGGEDEVGIASTSLAMCSQAVPTPVPIWERTGVGLVAIGWIPTGSTNFPLPASQSHTGRLSKASRSCRKVR